MEQTQVKITKDTNIGEIIENFPQTIETLEELGVHCVGCHVSAVESIEMGFKTHGMSDEQIADAVKKLNEVVQKNPIEKKEEKEFDYSTAKLNVTDKAAEKIKGLMTEHKKAGLRIGIVPGGCSGNSYSMELDDKSDENDIVIEEKGIKIFVDKKSITKMNNAKVDFVDGLQGAGFKIENPQAEKSCGCGSSFG
ncbi:iron-sulfur cluster assembly accessory protein [Candidatus Woesearchaeota archaeon]|nr:iron-sulfur cluster assembly accessory protein [Candidatus Woesearchaeota archaeon]